MTAVVVNAPAEPSAEQVVYPESDGKLMADNTRQFQWITVLAGNLAALFRDRPDVFVSGNQLWYPVEGAPEVRFAPDVYVVFGRPKGHRSSWKQWQEGDIPLTVVFEILSPGNTIPEMIEKQTWYEDHGVEEYYVYDPDPMPCSPSAVKARCSSGLVSPTASSAPDSAFSSTSPARRWPSSIPMAGVSSRLKNSMPNVNARSSAPTPNNSAPTKRSENWCGCEN